MITNNDISKISRLAKLSFTQQEIEKFASELTNVMDMIDALNELDCTNIEALTSVCEMSAPLRKDIAIDGDISEQLFLNCAGKYANLAAEVKCFIVPKVIE